MNLNSPTNIQIHMDSCLRHIDYTKVYKKKEEANENSFSIDSELLNEIDPINIDSEAVFEFRVKPEIDILVQANIKMKKYQSRLKDCQNTNQIELRKQLIEKVKVEAELALKKSKKSKSGPKYKWGHPKYGDDIMKLQYNHEQLKCTDSKSKEKKFQLKPISQRIIQYKQKQINKSRQSHLNCKKKHHEAKIDIQQNNKKIEENAKKILKQMKDKKHKEQHNKKIIQAKIRALQIKSLQHISACKKKKDQQKKQFQLGDSQYSTFQARAEGRKKQKRKKQVKNEESNLQQQNIKEKALNIKKSSSSRLSKTKKDNNKSKNKKQQKGQNGMTQNKKIAQISSQGERFYIWNIPITSQDVKKINDKQNDVFLNVDRFNYKHTKTFRQEANQYLANKMISKMEQHNNKTKEKRFLDEVEKKKQVLHRQFAETNLRAINEPFWNQDEIFRPNVLQNFHFFSKTSPQL